MKDEELLATAKIGPLLTHLAMPAIIAQLINVLYNVVDRAFIGRMPNGDIAMASVGIVFPITMIVLGVSALIGMGGAPIAAMKMGEANNDDAEKIMSNSFSMLIILGILVTTVLLIFEEPILRAFGASGATIGYAKDYLGIYAVGTIFVLVAFGMNPFITTQGFSKIGMMTIVIGAIINIVLDPIFIFGLGMGIKGAALATIIAQCASAIWAVIFLNGKTSIIKIKKEYLVPKFDVVTPIVKLGAAPFLMQSTDSLVIIILNIQLQKYGGDLAISAMAIMSSILQLILLPVIGLMQGAQPIISYNYGAKKIDRVRETFKLALTAGVTFTCVIWASLMLFPQFYVAIFSKDPELMKMSIWTIRLYFAGIFMMGAQIVCQQTFVSLGRAKISVFLALLRKVILLIPLIFILPMIFENDLKWVLLAEAISDVTASIITIISFSLFYKKALE